MELTPLKFVYGNITNNEFSKPKQFWEWFRRNELQYRKPTFASKKEFIYLVNLKHAPQYIQVKELAGLYVSGNGRIKQVTQP